MDVVLLLTKKHFVTIGKVVTTCCWGPRNVYRKAILDVVNQNPSTNPENLVMLTSRSADPVVACTLCIGGRFFMSKMEKSATHQDLNPKP